MQYTYKITIRRKTGIITNKEVELVKSLIPMNHFLTTVAHNLLFKIEIWSIFNTNFFYLLYHENRQEYKKGLKKFTQETEEARDLHGSMKKNKSSSENETSCDADYVLHFHSSHECCKMKIMNKKNYYINTCDLSSGWVSKVTTSGKWNCWCLGTAAGVCPPITRAGLEGVELLQLEVLELESGPPCNHNILVLITITSWNQADKSRVEKNKRGI